jgi:hypothetical protein
MMDSTGVARRGAVRIDETMDAIELYSVQGWTDGLPVVPLPWWSVLLSS